MDKQSDTSARGVEKITMEITKGEAMSILIERLENKWYVDLEALLVFLPAIFIAYGLYAFVSLKTNDWYGLFAVMPILVIAIYILFRLMRRRRHQAEKLYEQYKEGSLIPPPSTESVKS